MNTKSTAPQKPKHKTTSRSSSSPPKRRINRPPTINLTNPRFVFLPFFNIRLRGIIDGGSTWYYYDEVISLPYLGEAALLMCGRQRLVRRIIAKWDPFPSKMRKYPVISESDFFRLMYAAKLIDGRDPWDLEEDPTTSKLATPGGDFDAHDLESYRMRSIDSQAPKRQDKTGSPQMDDWNVRT
jgi:hypothetical protein